MWEEEWKLTMVDTLIVTIWFVPNKLMDKLSFHFTIYTKTLDVHENFS